MYELFTSEIFHLIFLGCGGLQVTETTENKTMDKVGPLYLVLKIICLKDTYHTGHLFTLLGAQVFHKT